MRSYRELQGIINTRIDLATMSPIELNIVSYDFKERESLAEFASELGWLVDSFSSIAELIDIQGEVSSKHVIIYSVPKNFYAMEDEIQRIKNYLKKNRQQQLILIVHENFKSSDKLAIELGARHLLFKPISYDDLKEILSRIATGIGKRRLKKLSSKTREPENAFSEIIYASEKMQQTIELARKVAESECTSVMITGECGTGKGTLARAIHNASSRKDGPFIEINCAAIPRNLLESEFFGYEKGAFTDAREEKPGLFELANGGTIFLDEVSEIDYSLQAKLLKFLDTRMVRRISGVKFLPVDVRIISASNKDLREEVRERRFREDLFYRLNVVEINIPPLRERKEDIEPIATAYLKRFSRRFNKMDVRFSDKALQAIKEYAWPGNVRELINAIERAVLLNHTGVISIEDLPIDFEKTKEIQVQKAGECVKVSIPEDGVSLEEVEKGLIVTALEKAGGNIMEAARLLKLGRGALRYKIKKYGIDAEKYRETV
ncbi:MAG: hypothetical protein DRG59_13965, partial [Deltaproteobacteria bacterium]